MKTITSRSHNGRILVALLLIAVLLLGSYIAVDKIIDSNKIDPPPVDPKPVDPTPPDPEPVNTEITDKSHLAFLNEYLRPVANICYGYQSSNISDTLASTVVLYILTDEGSPALSKTVTGEEVQELAYRYFRLGAPEGVVGAQAFTLRTPCSGGFYDFSAIPYYTTDINEVAYYWISTTSAVEDAGYDIVELTKAEKDGDRTVVTYSYSRSALDDASADSFIGTVTIILNAENTVISVKTTEAE